MAVKTVSYEGTKKYQIPTSCREVEELQAGKTWTTVELTAAQVNDLYSDADYYATQQSHLDPSLSYLSRWAKSMLRQLDWHYETFELA